VIQNELQGEGAGITPFLGWGAGITGSGGGGCRALVSTKLTNGEVGP
jgi:hypothetical protein